MASASPTSLPRGVDRYGLEMIALPVDPDAGEQWVLVRPMRRHRLSRRRQGFDTLEEVEHLREVLQAQQPHTAFRVVKFEAAPPRQPKAQSPVFAEQPARRVAVPENMFRYRHRTKKR